MGDWFLFFYETVLPESVSLPGWRGATCGTENGRDCICNTGREVLKVLGAKK